MTTHRASGSDSRVASKSRLNFSVQQIHVVLFGTPSTHRDPYPASTVNFSVREPRLSTVVDSSLELFGSLIVFGGKSNQTKRLGLEDFHIKPTQLLGQCLAQINMFSNGVSKFFSPLGVQRQPQFERSEASS